MFGYVRTCKGEMRVKEYELYSASYCGLCRAMGKCTGQLSRFTLSYDFVFLYLVRCALACEKPSVSFHRCPAHPLKKRPMTDFSESAAYAARASAGLCAFKLEDDISDSKRGKRLAFKALSPFFSHFKKKACLPELEITVKKKLESLSLLEDERCASLDKTAEVFGELLGEVFCYGLDGDKRTLAYEVGFHTGKFIYAADAADDYLSDIKSGSYNPLIEIYGDSLEDSQKESIKTALLCELGRLEAAVNLIDFSSCPDIREIIYNVIYLGMPEVMHKALYNCNDKKSERKSRKK